MKTPGSTPVSAMRIRSPRTAPPVYGDVGSTATTPTFFARPRRVRTRRLMRELLPTPGGPVNPTTWARPVCGWIRARASVASGSSSSIREMSFPAARLSPFRRESTRPGTGPRGRAAVPFRAGTRSRPFACGLEEGDDFAERRTGAEHDLDAGLLELGNVFLRNDPAARDEDVARLPFLEELHDLREQGHVRPAEARQADRVDVLLDRGLDDVLRRLPQAGVDDLHAGVAQRAGDDLGPAVVAVESRFRDQDADLLRDRTTSIQERFLVSAEDLAHHVADLAERRLRPDRVEDERHRVVVRFARLPEAVESGRVLLRVPRSANLAEPGRLGLERRLRDPQDLEIRLFVHDEIVDADDHPLAVLDLPLVAVCGVRNLLLEAPFPDRGDDARERVEPEEPRPRVLRAEGIPHLPRPDPSGGAILRDLLEQVVVGVKEEREAVCEVVDFETAVDTPSHILHAIRQREGQFLSRGGAGLPDVVPADRDRVPQRHLLRPELEGVDDEAHRRLRREDPLLLGLIFLEDVVLDRAP